MKGVQNVSYSDSKPWRVQIKVGEKENGKPIMDGSYHETKAMAEREATKIRHDLQNDQYQLPTQKTLREQLEDWMKHKEAQGLKQSTLDRYGDRIQAHLDSDIADDSLTDLTPGKLRKFLETKLTDGKINEDGGLHQETVRKLYVILNQTLDLARKDGLLQDNPMDSVSIPKQKNSQNQIDDVLKDYDVGKIRRLIDHFKQEDTYGAFLLTKLYTGMRLSELRGLKEQYVDLDDGIIQVRETMVSVSGDSNYETTPKNDSSKRTIELSNSTIELLRNYQETKEEWKNQAGKDWESTPYFFTTKNGKPVHANNLRRRHFYPIFEEDDKLPRIRLHDLRHLHITLLIAHGDCSTEEAVLIAAKRAGHSSTKMVWDRYGHVLQGRQKEAVDNLQSTLQLDDESDS